MTDEEILKKEADFADSNYAPYANDLNINPEMFRQYADPKYFWDWREFSAHLLGELKDKCVLDLGCGMGEEAVYFAKLLR